MGPAHTERTPQEDESLSRRVEESAHLNGVGLERWRYNRNESEGATQFHVQLCSEILKGLPLLVASTVFECSMILVNGLWVQSPSTVCDGSIYGFTWPQFSPILILHFLKKRRDSVAQ